MLSCLLAIVIAFLRERVRACVYRGVCRFVVCVVVHSAIRRIEVYVEVSEANPQCDRLLSTL